MQFRAFTLITLGLLLQVSLFAQQSVNLSIEHYLQDQPFAFNQEALTHDGQAFDVTRLAYYVSEITFTDQNGNAYSPDSVWTLVDASQATDIDLGTAPIDSVVSITFHIGVDSAFNHLDPSEWPEEHPLAHKDPSMHWGWANGYRFNAMEGKSGASLNQLYELHGLGNENFFSVTVNTSAGAENGVIDILVYGNYAEILKGMDISDGIISHGPLYEAKTSLENMRDYVFGPSVPVSTVDTTTSLGDLPKDASPTVYPNPTQHTLYSADPISGWMTDLSGRTVLRFQRTRQLDVHAVPSGVYMLYTKGHGVEKVVIQ